MSIVILLAVIAIIALFSVRDFRMQFITRPTFSFFKKVLPPLSSTEKAFGNGRGTTGHP